MVKTVVTSGASRTVNILLAFATDASYSKEFFNQLSH